MSLQSSENSSENQLLKAAWLRQKAYDRNAVRYQKRFTFLRTLLAILSVAVIILSVIKDSDLPILSNVIDPIIDRTLLLLPITITGLLAFSVRFDRGQNWILLRGNAESLKMELYYYRTRVGDYRQNRDTVLAKRIKRISESIKGGPVHLDALSPYENETPSQLQMGVLIHLITLIYKKLFILIEKTWAFLFQFKAKKPDSSMQDDTYSDLTEPEKYLTYRLENQFSWYRNRAKKLARQLQTFEASIYLFGGVGTLLAALDTYQKWVAVTVAITGALTNYLELKRVETSLVGYNQAADALYDIRAWWYSLPMTERKKPENFSKLVKSCEETIRSETSSWLQDMQDRLSQLYGAKEDDTPDDTSSERNNDE